MDLLTPASSIARDFAQLPKSVHSTSAISIAEEFAEVAEIHSHSHGTLRGASGQASDRPPAPSGAARTSRWRFGRFRNIAFAR
jgi:hypothetical protein